MAGIGLSEREKSALAVVKVRGCAEANASNCAASEGTGAIIHSRGLILTALHAVIEDPNDVTMTLPTRWRCRSTKSSQAQLNLR